MKIKSHDLVTALVGEMRNALEAMERNDYHGAFQILEARCRPSDSLTAIPPGFDDIGLRRVALQVFKAMPAPLMRPGHEVLFQWAVYSAHRLLSADPSTLKPEDYLVTTESLGDFGVTAAWEFKE
ncbi:MAG TPA: hypothetical protein VEY92_05700 [Pseudoxanthomonas sp.]|nr:hypothetical protein [Pseudoxanthomonas sp.]